MVIWIMGGRVYGMYVGDHLKSSDWAQNLDVKDRDRDNSDSHTSQRRKKEIK